MSQLTSKEFWKDTADRTIRTMAQTAIAACGTATVIKDVDWKAVAGTTLLAGLLCVLTCIATSGSTNTISPASTIKNPNIKSMMVADLPKHAEGSSFNDPNIPTNQDNNEIRSNDDITRH